MLLVILGAGASHGCVPGADRSALPLTSQLFEPSDQAVKDANRIVPSAGPVVARVTDALKRGEHGGDIEAILGEIAEKAEARGGDLQEHLAAMRFWLFERVKRAQEVVKEQTAGVTLYSSLLNQLDDWGDSVTSRVVIVTFNYDTLIDEALFAHSTSLAINRENQHEVGNSAMDGGRWILFRPHGSIDWFRAWPFSDEDDALGSPRSIAQLARVRPEDGKFIHGTLGGKNKGYEGLVNAPAIAVPLSKKSRFECPASQVDLLEGVVKQVNKVVTIGWRGREEHFTKILSSLREDVPLVVVDPDERAALDSAEHLRVAAEHRQVGYAARSFAELIEQPDKSPLVGDRSTWYGIS